MKKLIALLLTLTTIFSFTACGSKDNGNSSANPVTGTYTGVLEEKSDFMIVVSSEEGKDPYIFNLDEGVTCDAEVGDTITIDYTGDITKYDTFSDEHLIATLVEPAE